MPVESMTGFSRHDAAAGGVSVVWELKSVNGKSLDIRLRLANGWERLEPLVRQRFQAAFVRGNIQANLSIDEGSTASRLILNEAMLQQVEQIAATLSGRMNLAAPSIAELLSIKGVLETDSTVSTELLEPALLAALDAAISSLKTARAGEGSALAAILSAQVDLVEDLTLRAEADGSRHPDAIRGRIAENIALLMAASPALDEMRLAAEALFVANRADIREEIDRLKTHVISARKLLGEGGAVGRKLDFLAQEFNREANTLCSKSNAGSITSIGLELKSVVDQFREQVQNLE
jgi:uncharacterized protein (TIGR00255 family)